MPVLGLAEHRRVAAKSADEQVESQGTLDKETNRGGVQWCINNCLLKALNGHVNRWVVIILFVGLWIGSIIAFTEIEADLNLAFAVPDDSYFQDYFEVYGDGFGTPTFPEYDIVILDQDWSNATVRAKLDSLILSLSLTSYEAETILEYEYLSVKYNWLDSYEEALNSSFGTNINAVNSQQFYSFLQIFADLSNFYDNGFIVYDDLSNPTKLTATRFVVMWNKPSGFDDQWPVRNDIVDKIEAEFGKGNGYVMDPFMPYYYYNYYARDYVLHCLLVMFICALVLLPFLMDLRLAVFVFITLVGVYACIFGWMGLFCISIDVISFLMIIFGFGIVVDYLVYATHGMAASAAKEKRFGAVVIRSFVASILGAILFLFSTADVFRTFCYMFSGILLVTMLHALLFVPAVMGEWQWLRSATQVPELETEKRDDKKVTMMDNAIEMGKGKNERKSKKVVRQESGHSVSQNSHSEPVKPGDQTDDEQSGAESEQSGQEQSGQETSPKSE